MYNEFFGFSEKPFEVTPDPKFLYLTSSHRAALNAMMRGIKTRQGFISVTGEVGTGKTTLIHSLLTGIDHRVKTAFIFHTLITFEELLASILRELYVKVNGNDKDSLLLQLVEYLGNIDSSATVAVIIDEAQYLSAEILQELADMPRLSPLLSRRLRIYFVGQPEFDSIITLPGLQNLNQQIKIKRKIKPLTAAESRDYIEHRLKIAGSSAAEIFSLQALTDIIRHAKGIPRVINILCDNALLGGFSESKKKIDEKAVRAAIKNMEGPVTLAGIASARRKGILTSWQFAVILLLGLGGIAFATYGFLRYGHSDLQNIKSMWTSLFHTGQPHIALSQTEDNKTSIVSVRQSPVEKAAQPVESLRPAVVLPATPVSNDEEEPSMETIIVKEGQSVTSLALDNYRVSNITMVALILQYNPGITNANRIIVNQKVRIPKIKEENLIISYSDRTYKINVGTFGSPEFAGIYRAEPLLKGKEIEVIPAKAGQKSNWYRVVVGKFNSKKEALEVISALRARKLLPVFGAFPKLK